MSSEVHKCSYGNLEEVSVVEKSLISRGLLKVPMVKVRKTFRLTNMSQFA